MEEFADYKEKQEYFKKRKNMAHVFHTSKKGGRPYNKKEERRKEIIKKIKLERMFGKQDKEVSE